MENGATRGRVGGRGRVAVVSTGSVLKRERKTRARRRQNGSDFRSSLPHYQKNGKHKPPPPTRHIHTPCKRPRTRSINYSVEEKIHISPSKSPHTHALKATRAQKARDQWPSQDRARKKRTRPRERPDLFVLSWAGRPRRNGRGCLGRFGGNKQSPGR